MKIKRSSWHYKISNFSNAGYENKNDNLCNYFWRIVGKLLVSIFGTAWIIFLLYEYFTSPFVISTTIMVLFIISIVAVPALVIHHIRKKKGKPIELPYENVFYEYLKAKKRKVCPIIEYVD